MTKSKSPLAPLRYCMSVLLFCVFSVASAQTKTNKASLTEGPEVDTKRSTIKNVIGSDQTGYYIIRAERKETFIEHLDRALTTDKSAPIGDQKDGSMDLYYNDAIMLDGKIYIFFSGRDSREFKNNFYYETVDMNSLQVDNHPQNIGSHTYPNRRAFQQSIFSLGGMFFHASSPAGDHLLLYNEVPQEEGSSTSDIRFHLDVYGSGMKKEWGKDLTLPFPRDQYGVEQIKINDAGHVFVTGIEYQEKSEARASRREGKPSYTYHISYFTNKGAEYFTQTVDLPGKFITDMQIDEAENGDIVISGFYSEKGTFSIKGAFYEVLDHTTHAVKVQKQNEFETDFITQYYTAKQARKAKKKEEQGEEPELFQFQLDELILRKDGGATLIAEQFYTYTVTTTTTDAQGHMTTTTTTYYNYNDLLVLSFNPDGSLQWKSKIPKRQTTSNDGGYYSSYTFATVGDKLFFIFNDNPKNLFIQPGQNVSNFTGKEIAVVFVEVDGQGKVSKELLMTSERGDIYIRPKMSLQTGEKEMLLLGEKAKAYQFNKVVIK